MTDNLANKISDLKKLADERKQLIVSRTPGGTGKLSSSPTRQNTASASASAPLLERPASRVEIHSLELELEERVRLVLDSSNFVRNPNEFGLEFSYQPHKEAMMLTRERMLNDLHATLQDLEHEPWLDSYVKCECLKQTCDEVSSRFADMLGVNSTELGSVARKLRLTYKQSFEQMAVSWKNLRKQFTSNETELSNLKKQIAVLTRRLENKEEEISSRFDKEIARISREYQEEKERDQAQLAQAELKMDQMSDTLKYLNGIFRAMQNDTASLKTADLHTLVAKLTKENDDLKKENTQFDTIKTQLFNALTKIKTLEGTVRSNNDEIQRLNLQLQRREEAINHLMEKDTIRTAEIEKLQRISKMKDEEILAMDMKDVATSVLCIKCKKSLDDMTNIRSTLMADQAQNPAQRLQCENYRILLPNLRNRKPHRTTPWIRSVIRCILLSKVKEDLSLHFLKGDAMTFPAFTYAWFRRHSDGLTGTALTKLLVLSDEDRWGLYYGIKALHKEDSEASFFWSLLDETFGQDGLRFALYCLSVILSLGGKALWRQFGSAMTHGSSINTKLEDDSSVRANIWIDIATAKEGVAMILTKALAPHLNDALDSIDALKVKPEDILPPNPANNNTTSGVAASPTNQSNEYSSTSSVRIVHEEPTHISLFTWLRIMLQQFHADQIHRNAAIRLMFETASVGALTPANHNDGGNGRGGASGTSGTNSTHVEYPQFQSICQTLFPYLSICEIGNLYARCHYAGKRRVTAEVFHYQADIHGFFALSLKLNTLPLLKQLNLEEEIAALASSEEGKNDGGEGISSIIPSTSSAGTVHSMPMVNGAFSSTPGARGGGANNAMNLNTSDEPHYTKRSLFVIRSKLATVVHRRFAGLMPGLKYMMKYLPERWKATLIDCMELVTTSLNDTFNKLKELNKQFQTPPSAQGGSRGGEKETTNKGANTSSPSSLDRFLFLDGIQPYLHYRRLLSLVIFLQSCNENPYLPTEIFTAVVIKNNKQNIEKAVLRIEKIMESLENVIFSPSDLDYVNLPQRILHKYDRFQTTRHVLVVRRIQAVFKKFLSKEVAIPRSVRMVMAAGYLTNSVHQEHLFQPTTEVVEGGLVTTTPGVKKGGFYSAPLKHREVYHEPWWAQVHIANIYLFKISYDMKASQLGKEGINLPQAISAYFYCVWGSMDVAERSIQDLFVAIKSYRFNMPRLRLFAAFVGDGRDLEGDNVEEVFATSEAVSIYYSLLFAIHRQLAKKREYMLRLASKSSGKDHTKMQKSGNSYTIIETLFPSTENTFQRNDKREIWLMDADLLTQAAKVWAGQQSWLKGQIGLFSDLPEKLRPDIQNRVDVDDFLWLMMMQWAKLEVFHVKKCLARGSLIEKSIFGSGAAPTPATPSNANNPPPSGDPGTPQNMLMMKEGFLSRRLSVLPLSNLKSIVESIYRPEDGDDLADIQHYATAFIKSIRSRRAVLPQPVESTSSSTVALSNETIQRKLNNIRNLDRQFGSELQKLLKDCVLWDTNLAFVDSPAQPAVSASDRPTSSTATREGSISPTKKRTTSVSKASFLGRTSLFNLAGVTIDENAVNASSTPLVLGEGEKFKPSMSERGSLGGVGAEAMTVHYSAASIKLSHYADNTIIGNGVFSEMMFVMSKAAFSSYQGPINVFLDKLSNDARLGKDSDVKSRIQAIRLHLLQVGEFFQLHDLSTNHQQTISTKIFNFELLGAVEDLKDTYIERTRYMKLANDSMQKLQSLFASVSDLAVLTKQEFPRDTWQKGAKIHLERAFVYNIATKNALLQRLRKYLSSLLMSSKNNH